MGTGAYESNHEYVTTHQNEYIWFITALIHGYRCFISILTRLYFLNVPELAFWKADVDNMMFGRLFPFFPPSCKEHTFSSSHVLFSFSLNTRGFLVTIRFISILTRPYLSNVLH